MPIYEYQCTECGERAEIIQNFSDPPHTICGGAMKKLFSAPAIQFKGSGFYKTDYASKSSAAPDSKSESGDTKSETKSETKGEAKAETKTETKSETKSESKSETNSDK
jgi:putative FmdB family regulatory protein